MTPVEESDDDLPAPEMKHSVGTKRPNARTKDRKGKVKKSALEMEVEELRKEIRKQDKETLDDARAYQKKAIKREKGGKFTVEVPVLSA